MDRRNLLLIVIAVVLVVLIAIPFFLRREDGSSLVGTTTPGTATTSTTTGGNLATIDSFEECMAAGFPVMESFPRQCRTSQGQNFIENLNDGNMENSNLIVVTNPKSGQTISSPLAVQGQARGNWYFEASFPVRLLDANGKELAVVPAQAQGEWMTTNFVPFQATLRFATSTTRTGTLVLEKDNPSGLPQNAAQIRIPVVFRNFTSGTTTTLTPCFATGCSGQVCSDREVVTTCEFRPEYACYRQAKCERQANNQCGWTQTTALRSCLNQAAQSTSTQTF